MTGHILKVRFRVGSRCFVHDVKHPLNPEERTKCDAAPRPPFTDVAPSLVGGEVQELPFHRVNLVEIR